MRGSGDRDHKDVLSTNCQEKLLLDITQNYCNFHQESQPADPRQAAEVMSKEVERFSMRNFVRKTVKGIILDLTYKDEKYNQLLRPFI